MNFHSSPIRIALVTSGYSSGGGVPSVANWLTTALRASGTATVEIHDLACSSHDDLSRRITQPASWFRRTLREQESNLEFTRWGTNLAEIERMRYQPRRELTDVLNTYDLVQVVSGSPALANVAANSRPPVVAQVATRAEWERTEALSSMATVPRIWRGSMTRLTGHAEDLALRSASAIMVENYAMLEYARGLSSALVQLAPPGVDTERYFPSPSGWNSGRPLLSLCRFGDPRKGLERLLHSYASLVALDTAVPNLTVAGRGTPPKSLTQLAERLTIQDRVLFRSNVAPDDLPGLYRNSSVFVQTSYEEGLGISTLEAMASGLPAVCSETEGSQVAVQMPQTGVLIKQAPLQVFSTEFAKAVARVLATSGDTMSIAARSRAVSNFSTDVALMKFLDAYASVL